MNVDDCTGVSLGKRSASALTTVFDVYRALMVTHPCLGQRHVLPRQRLDHKEVLLWDGQEQDLQQCSCSHLLGELLVAAL